MDDRIIGINWYFRRDANDDWVLLQYTDLLEGDKYYWGEYNTTDHSTYGIFSGTLNIKSGNDLNLHKACSNFKNKGSLENLYRSCI